MRLRHQLPACLSALALLGATALSAAETRTLSTNPAGGLPTVGQFLDSVGVATHWNYGSTVYGQRYAELTRLLIDSGIKHQRAGCDDPAGAGSSASAVRDLRQRAGIRSTVSFEPDYGSIASQINCVKGHDAAQPGSVAAIEGPNEPDLFWAPRQTKTYQGQGFPAGPKAFLCDMFQAINNPTTGVPAIPVVGMSFGVTYGSAPAPYGNGELAPCVDFGNIHPYAGGVPFAQQYPYAGLPEYANDSSAPGNSVFDFPFYYNKTAAMYAPKPMMATEVGYTNTPDGTPESVVAKYAPRIFLEHFRLGTVGRATPGDASDDRTPLVRTFLYELADVDPDPSGTNPGRHFGLIRNDLTPKPAYVALKNFLLRLRAGLDDPPVTSNVGAVRVTVNPPANYGRTEFVRSMLLKRADGGYALVLWHEIANSNQETSQVLTHPAIPVTVSFNVPAASAKRYAFTGSYGFALSNSYANVSTVNVSVTDTASIIFFR